MTTVLLTGASGFLGSHAAVALLEAGHRVIGVDSLDNSHPDAVRRAGQLGGSDIDLHVMDIRETDKLTHLLHSESVDTVMHFAGLKSVADSISDPLSYYDVNTAGSISLFRAMDTTGVRRLVFSSSCTVYGNQSSSASTAETSDLTPINPYGRSKTMVEQILADLASADTSWEITSLRYFNPAGAHPSGCIGEDPKGTPNNLMPLVMACAIDGDQPLTIHGDDYDTPDGTCVRDYIHVLDLAAGHVAAIENLVAGMHAFNLGTGVGVSVLELVEAARRVTGSAIPVKIGPRRPGDAASVVAGVSAAVTSLDWRAELGLDRMCEDHWRWLKANPGGYDR